MIDSLGDRMKRYEESTRYFLTPRTYTIIRCDGKAFHTFTKGLNKPWDDNMSYIMTETCKYLCENIQGAKLGYTQSDEISIILTDFDKIETSSWFDGNIQKMCSISASLATGKFNSLSQKMFENKSNNIALFDSRVFILPTRTEVLNYLIWRQQDAVRNSIQGLAQSLYSHKEINNKNCNQLQEMCFQKGHNWNDTKTKYKRGTAIYKKQKDERSYWYIDEQIPTFTENREFLENLIINNI